MGFNFYFTLASDEKDVRKLNKFLLKQPLDYPNYGDWVDKTKQEMLSGYKKSILAFSDDILVGDLVFQAHKQFPRVKELKNLRVHPKLQQRYFASFMLKQAEKENELDYDAIICDTRSDRVEVMRALKFNGYAELIRASFYDKNIEDVVMVKKFDRTPTGIFRPFWKSFN